MITEDSVITTGGNQVSSDLAGEAVILNMEDGVYYGLDAVGARIWQLIQEPKSVKEVHGTLLEEFDVEPDRCMSDLLAVLQSLEDHHLITVRPG